MTVGLVSIFIVIVAVWLVATGRISSPGLVKYLRSLFVGRQSGLMHNINHESGHCYVVIVPEQLLSDREVASWVHLFEDGKPIGPAHCPHDQVRQFGGGRFSHWGAEVYFSSSDNSDPRTNGRDYAWREIAQ